MKSGSIGGTSGCIAFGRQVFWLLYDGQNPKKRWKRLLSSRLKARSFLSSLR